MSPTLNLAAVSLAAPQLLRACGFEVAAYTHACPGRDQPNEDGVLVLDGRDDTLIVAVADGAGGHPGGDTASARALAALLEAWQADPGLPPRAAILNGFENAHRVIKQDGGATTLAVVELGGATLRAYHAGDSGVLVTGQRGRIRLQSVFHSPTGYAVEAGLLDEAEALHHEHRHFVSNLVGMEPMTVAIGSPLLLAPYDTVVIASDGLYDNLYVSEIVDIVRKGALAAACLQLVDVASERMIAAAAGQPSKPDDLSVVVVRRARR